MLKDGVLVCDKCDRPIWPGQLRSIFKGEHYHVGPKDGPFGEKSCEEMHHEDLLAKESGDVAIEFTKMAASTC
ncbi:MAG: hypothetical protein UW07_C0018G0014 [Candidatus Nomurabacteria bacterium GW2011_GWF2_43_8]|uniref:Uncharacterized protein n=3 Tax=Candidatus Nomuraibacteriota TaxID=1752729 RepID=A0A0G1FQG7_9BACT|nr:MAG: hypothetical protein UV76_C0012G0012 [Candidatus Nomurabacteria bacterium GW2011_GWA2_43_15]KKT18825.1 MAG: hypothetical protein UW02_C0021G0023 [Candidatus Nomurabacteria bacterium GW2011_GWB1_43_7]KKT24313.1 MAG: hypothetical protein UW07_C0018G0014 [Candidatus Nomurabacteria bacterium GW2011_GWF2_43_8]